MKKWSKEWMDEKVSEWHADVQEWLPIELHEHLELTWEEYAVFVRSETEFLKMKGTL